MADDTAAALKVLIEQMTKLTTTVDAQSTRLDALQKFNGKILDEKKDKDRELDASAKFNKLIAGLDAKERDARLIAEGYVLDDDKQWVKKSAAHTITREDARDTVKYRAAKAAAAKDGVTLTIARDNDDERDGTTRNLHRPDPVDPSLTTVSFDDDHHKIRYVRADHETGRGLIARRMAAEAAGFTVRTFRTADDLPPHMQQKLALIESANKAANE